MPSDHQKFSNYLLQNPNYYVDLLSSPSASEKAEADGYDLPENFKTYLDDAIEKTRVFIRDQTHVLELKSAQMDDVKIMGAGVARSGGNGAVGTGW